MIDETPIFEETQRLFLWNFIVAVSAAAIFCGIYFSMQESWAIYLALGAALLDLIVLSGFARLSIVVTPTELRFGLPIWTKRFALSDVTVGEVEKISLAAGIGIHWMGKYWVYNARLGRGVRLTARGTNYLLGSRDPEKLMRALQQVLPAHHRS